MFLAQASFIALPLLISAIDQQVAAKEVIAYRLTFLSMHPFDSQNLGREHDTPDPQLDHTLSSTPNNNPPALHPQFPPSTFFVQTATSAG